MLMDDTWRWLKARSRAAQMAVERCTWSDNREWKLTDGRLHHVTGRFFTIIGVKERKADGTCLSTPMIDQPERGLLGFLVSEDDGEWYWLLQAKAEPGNVGGVQIGPTVQATLSNLECVHAGRPTRYLEHLVAESEIRAGRLPGVLQSEQGTRFLEKYNHNTVVELAENIVDDHDDWRWVSASVLRGLLLSSFCVNTDARSVIASADWKYISRGKHPFAQNVDYSGMFASLQEAMRRSYLSPSPDLGAMREALAEADGTCATVCSLEELTGWGFTPDAFRHRGSGSSTEIVSVNVVAPRREVSRWQQPLVSDSFADSVVLLSTVIDGDFRVALTVSDEPGFQGNSKFGPSWQRALHAASSTTRSLGEQVCRIEQSDEGGRFDHIVVGYEWRHAACAEEGERGLFWVSLAELEALCQAPGLTTNELRTVVTLLLAVAA